MVRDEFLEVAAVAAALIGHDVVGESWHEPSALTGYEVSGLAGHLARGILTVETYLAQPGGAPEVSAAEYFVKASGDLDPIDSPMHREVRSRSASEAADGQAQLEKRVIESVARLRRELNLAASDRTVSVLGGMAMLLDEYLVTRLVELVVHVDDLAVSIGSPTPDLPSAALHRVAMVLADVAARRNGDMAFIRALARRERVENWPHAL